MLRILTVSTLMFGSILGLAQAQPAPDRDHNYNQNYNQRDNQRIERRAPVRYEQRDVRRNDRDRDDRRVIGDRRYGYYDRFNHWCWY